jgi:hypothetical protein
VVGFYTQHEVPANTQADDDAWRGTELARQVAQPRAEALTPVHQQVRSHTHA